MHEIEPYFGWLKYYNSVDDELSPFYGKEHSEFEFTDNIYGYCIHPQWDYIGSESLYLKVLYVNYELGTAIIEFIGEWNDALHNDIMHLKRNLIDDLVIQGVNKYILIGENVYLYHHSDDSYYEEWFEDVEDGWIVAMGFQEHVMNDWQQYNIDTYINIGGQLDLLNWRTLKPEQVFRKIDEAISRRLAGI